MTNFCAGWNISFGDCQSMLVYPTTVEFMPKDVASSIRSLPTIPSVLELYICWKSPLDNWIHGWVVAERGGKVALLAKSHDATGAKAVQEITELLRNRKEQHDVPQDLP